MLAATSTEQARPFFVKIPRVRKGLFAFPACYFGQVLQTKERDPSRRLFKAESRGRYEARAIVRRAWEYQEVVLLRGGYIGNSRISHSQAWPAQSRRDHWINFNISGYDVSHEGLNLIYELTASTTRLEGMAPKQTLEESTASSIYHDKRDD
jgi:hypothetical protein